MRFKKHRFEQYGDAISRLFPEFSIQNGRDPSEICCRTVTFQVTDACNLACTYCYQINKGKRKMSLETAKKFVDMILTGENGMSKYINVETSPGIIIEFIGGEPFLEIDLIDQICDYFMQRAIELDHQWAEFHCFSICTNGILYRDPRVQKFLNKHSVDISLNVTIDGNKELHDKCRVFHDGKPSYDIAVDAANDWMDRGFLLGSKITLAPDNITYLYDAITHFIDELGYDEINCNCVYEEGWQLCHATELYHQLKKIADYLIAKNLEQDVYFAMFDDEMFHPMLATDDRNWCGGTGMMLACDPDGYLYPCIRYMESSLGSDQPPYRIGSLDTGLAIHKCDKERLKCLDCITRRSQSTDECFNCPIGQGCAWCSGYNYQIYGTANKRATFICVMHKARALANAYFWPKVYKKYNHQMRYPCYIPDEWALEIISADEWNMIKSDEYLKHITDRKIIDQIINSEEGGELWRR